MVRHVRGIGVCRNGVPPGPGEGCALSVVKGYGWRESWQVLRAHLGRGFETRCKPNQRRLVERGSEEAYAQRTTENHARGNLHDRISRRCRQAGGPKNEMVSVEQVSGPGGVIRRRNHSVEVELTDGGVNSVHACIVVETQPLVLGKPSKYRLGISRARGQRVGEAEECPHAYRP